MQSKNSPPQGCPGEESNPGWQRVSAVSTAGQEAGEASRAAPANAKPATHQELVQSVNKL